jgi:phosphate transport system substrate-binding protein
MTGKLSVWYERVLIVALPIVLVAAILCAGCTGENRTPAHAETLLVSGSTTVLPVAQLTAEAFMAENPDVDLQISGGGSSVGIQAVGSGTADIGMASRDLKDSEKEAYPDLVKHVVALDGIVIIVNPENSPGASRWTRCGASTTAPTGIGTTSAVPTWRSLSPAGTALPGHANSSTKL